LRYPDRERVTENAEEIVRELLAFAEAEERAAREGAPVPEGVPWEPRLSEEAPSEEGRTPPKRTPPDATPLQNAPSETTPSETTPAGAIPTRTSEAGRARLLAAEILAQAGRSTEASRLLASVAESGPTEDDRAKALYLLGERYFFQGRLTPATGSGTRGSAIESWSALAERFPQSGWAQKVARPLRYLRFLDGAEAPPFEASFLDGGNAQGGKESRFSAEDLGGKVVALDFWRSSTPSQRGFEEVLARDLKQAFVDYPELQGKILVLGVNLDADRAAFQAAVEDWGIPWPQHHDGMGFETPLAALFGIPREPHLVLIDPQGRIAYLGPDSRKFFAALSREARRLRGVPAEPEK
jgi:hypothetical protein